MKGHQSKAMLTINHIIVCLDKTLCPAIMFLFSRIVWISEVTGETGIISIKSSCVFWEVSDSQVKIKGCSG